MAVYLNGEEIEQVRIMLLVQEVNIDSLKLPYRRRQLAILEAAMIINKSRCRFARHTVIGGAIDALA